MRRLAGILTLIAMLVASGNVRSSWALTTQDPPSACAEAQALESLGRLDAAEAAYLRELTTPTGAACAKSGLARLGPRAESCALAEALEAAGERTAAHDAYLKVLAANPASQCAKSGVEKTRATTSFWSSVGQLAENAGKLLAALVLVLLSATILVLLWLHVQTRWKRFPRMRDWWPAKKIRRPTLQIGTFDDAALKERLGVPIAGLIRGRVNWRSKDRYGPNLVSGQAGIASTLNSLGDISSETKGAVAVVKLLTATLPRRRFMLGGEIQPAGAQGPGISLELTIQGGYDSLVTFWANPLGLSKVVSITAYQHLAIVAAAWVDHRMVNAMDGENLLTSDPQSWAFFSSGVEWQRQGNYKLARQLYEQALIVDGDNVGALANLGIVERYENNFEEAEKLLRQAIGPTENSERAPKLAPTSNPDWYRIKYQLAGLYANWAAATDEPATLKRLREENAIKEARSLALATSQTIEDLSAQNPPPALAQFLEGTIEPDALVLAASTIPGSTATAWPDKPPKRGEVVAMLKAKTIDPWILIAFVENSSNRSTDTYYNLGCFYSMRGDFKSATERLLTAVRETQRSGRMALVEGVKIDPTLAPLRARLPVFLLKLEAAADEKLSNDKPEVAQFDLERQVIQWFESQGWNMDWADSEAGFTLIGRRDEETLLALVKSISVSQSDVNALIGARTRFHRCNPSGGLVNTALIAPTDKLPPDASDREVVMAVAIARNNEIDVYGAGEQGFDRVKA
jgi:tetratricopeptide (TPR) repeat protein